MVNILFVTSISVRSEDLQLRETAFRVYLCEDCSLTREVSESVLEEQPTGQDIPPKVDAEQEPLPDSAMPTTEFPEPSVEEQPAAPNIPHELDAEQTPIPEPAVPTPEDPEPPVEEKPAVLDIPHKVDVEQEPSSESAAPTTEVPEPPVEEQPAVPDIPHKVDVEQEPSSESTAPTTEVPEPPVEEQPAAPNIPHELDAEQEPLLEPQVPNVEAPEPPVEEKPAVPDIPHKVDVEQEPSSESTAPTTEVPEPPVEEQPAVPDIPHKVDAEQEPSSESTAPTAEDLDYPAKDRYKVEALRIDADAIDIDGEFKESFWLMASPATGFVQHEPRFSEKASERTEVRILYDEFNLYIGAKLYDTNPAGIIADEMRHDSDLGRNDTFLVIIDTYHDHRNGFYFETNPLGAKKEAQIFDEGKRSNFNWDGIWLSEAKITSEGWEVEIKIPFSTLRFTNKKLETWGVQFGRAIRRKNELVYWTPIPLDASKMRLSLAGHIKGLKAVRQGKNIEIKPYYLLQRVEQTTSEGKKKQSVLMDIGGDIKYFITPNFIADLTINPDFAQVEADELKINVTRFPLFFPEKREFFLERSGFFNFGLGGKVQPFFSRRIGIVGGKEIPIMAGGKLSGKFKDYNIGILSVQAREKSGEPRTNYSVLRLKKDILERSTVGLIAINKEPSKDNHNRTFGADLYLPIFDHLYIDSFVITTQTEGTSGDNEAGYVSLAWQDPSKYLSFSYLDVADRFNPEVGFVKRTNIKESVGYGELYIRPLESLVRYYSLYTSYVYLTDQQNSMIGRNINLGFTLGLNSGEYFEILYTNQFDGLDFDFEIRPGIIIPAGDYSLDTLYLSGSTDDRRKLSGFVSASFGEYFDGDRQNYSVFLSLRLSKHLKIHPGFTKEDINLPAGSFDANFAQTKIEYAISKKAFVNAFLQWNDDSEEISTNVRFNYEYRLGSDIYLVYNELRGTSGKGVKERAIVLKLTKLWSF
jgi:hypothetical protein